MDDPVPRTSIASDGSSYTVWSAGETLVASAGGPRGFTRPSRIAGSPNAYAAAAAPGGRAAVAYSTRGGVHVKPRGGRDIGIVRGD